MDMRKQHKYIGGRYIPILGGEWTNEKEYEPLVIVEYQGASYTSRTYVPIGTDIHNTNFWLCSGNYNAQVEHYRQEVTTLKNDMTNAYNQVIDEMKQYDNKILASTMYVNVKNYGAVGDGITDDTSAIQRALNENHGIYLPIGTYLVDTLVIDSFQTIYGENPDKTILLSSGNNVIETKNFSSLTGSGDSGGCSAFNISNLTIDGNNHNITGLNLYGYRYVIDNCNIKQCGQNGIYGEWCKALGVGKDGDVMEAYITRVRVHHCGYGIKWYGSHDSIIDNCFIYLNQHGIKISNSETSYADGTILSNVHVYANKFEGVDINASVIGMNLISESNGYQNDAGNGHGVIINGQLTTLNSCSIFSNKGTGIVLNDYGNTVTGAVRHNTNDIDIRKPNLDGNYISLNSIHEVKILNPENISAMSTYRFNGITGFGGTNQHLINVKLDLPSSIGEENKIVNTYSFKVTVFLPKSETRQVFIRRDGLMRNLYGADHFTLLPKDEVWFLGEVPESWTLLSE